jgi:hypothetical protein
MRVIAKPRHEGKTTDLIQWLRDSPDDQSRVIVSANSELSMYLYRQHLEEFESWQFVGLNEVTQGAWSGVRLRGKEIVLALDDVDMLIRNAIKYWPVDVVTMTVD